ncbi:ribonuclease type III Dicer [Toxoplasma gondii GAB2-2007-GAL-DOM2]|nr:ribonuclease type III Dicer [Toxoplasma gondii GAB2-2007-GAL-DOM2]KFG43099.1 ribonuclease type III Dicer [Toxoplasma gondii FOU]RQX74137.1 ribonuclease type III Dicer [Toxoplasma gondii CAST]
MEKLRGLARDVASQEAARDFEVCAEEFIWKKRREAPRRLRRTAQGCAEKELRAGGAKSREEEESEEEEEESGEGREGGDERPKGGKTVRGQEALGKAENREDGKGEKEEKEEKEAKEEKEEKEEKEGRGNEARTPSAWAHTKSVADVYEALGAVSFISAGYDVQAVWRAIRGDFESCAAQVEKFLAQVVSSSGAEDPGLDTGGGEEEEEDEK